jgi:hypothetical protein
MTSIKTIILLLCLGLTTTQGFTVTESRGTLRKDRLSHVPAQHQIPQMDSFSKRIDMTRMSLSPLDEDEKENVNVNLIPNVDSFTLTAIGFGLIAFNFFVFANMGDAGIGGLVARIINSI